MTPTFQHARPERIPAWPTPIQAGELGHGPTTSRTVTAVEASAITKARHGDRDP
jgi:hypothetical protein